MYVVVRNDISPGLQAAQAVHAAFDFAVEHSDIAKKWHEESNYLVILACENEAALLDHADRLTGWCAPDQACRVPFTLVTEPDIGNEHTALAIAPGPYWRHLSDLPLALRQEVSV